MISTILEPLV